MPARVGPAPWHDYTAVQGLNNQSSRRQSFATDNGSWDMYSGWHYSTSKDAQRKARYITGSDGKRHRVYTYGEYDFNGFSADAPNKEDRLAYASHAFSDPERVASSVDGSEEETGHIVKIEYANLEQIMRVTFRNGDICIFFRTPTSVAGQLISLANSRSYITDAKGKKRHTVGIRFWDLVRIRGQRRNARYPFEYENKTAGKYVNYSNDRTEVKIANAEILAAMERIGLTKFMPLGTSLHVGDTITMLMSKDEYSKLIYELSELTNNKYGNIQDLIIRAEEQETKSPEELYLEKEELEENTRAGRNRKSKNLDLAKEDAKRESILVSLANYIQDNAEEKWNAKLNDKDVQYFINQLISDAKLDSDNFDYELAKSKINKAVMAMKGTDFLKNTINTRKGTAKQIDNYRKLRETFLATMEDAGFGKHEINGWIDSNFPELRMFSYTVGKKWTPETLKEFANSKVPNNISEAHEAAYKKFIRNKDWAGAYNFLKNNKHDVKMRDKYGKEHTYYNQKYISDRDTFELEE